MRRSRSFTLLIVLVLVALLAAAAALFISQTRVTAEETAGRYLEAWESGDYGAMRALTVSAPADFAARHKEWRKELEVTQVGFRAGESRESGQDAARVGYTAAVQLEDLGTWTYDGRLRLARADGEWRVDWSPATVHPALGEDEHLDRALTWPERAPIRSAGGSRLDTPDASGSVQQLVGGVLPASEGDLKQLGEPYDEEAVVGQGGLQETFERQLAGEPGGVVRVVDSNGAAGKTLTRFSGQSGTPLQTTLDLDVQQAAADAVRDQRKPTSLVALRPSTGEILAVANSHGGFNRALLGQYPPGSTFKVVTAAGLLSEGVSADQQVGCPATTTINGREYQNYEHHDLGQVSFHTAFAQSCNTSFAQLATERLDGESLRQTARTFGFGQPLTPGVPSVRGEFPLPQDETELAAASFGQARVVASPLLMATVAGAAADGTWRPPTLVNGQAAMASMSAQQVPRAEPHRLDPAAAKQLDDLMSAVVTEGTAKGVAFPPGVAGKTGTAEFGSGENPPTHAWFIGHRGDLAFAVLVEGGGVGAEAAGPIAADFLRAAPG